MLARDVVRMTEAADRSLRHGGRADRDRTPVAGPARRAPARARRGRDRDGERMSRPAVTPATRPRRRWTATSPRTATASDRDGAGPLERPQRRRAALRPPRLGDPPAARRRRPGRRHDRARARSAAVDGPSVLASASSGAARAPRRGSLFKAYGLYDRDMKRISHTTIDDLPWLFHACVVGTPRCCGRYFKLRPPARSPFSAVPPFALVAGGWSSRCGRSSRGSAIRLARAASACCCRRRATRSQLLVARCAPTPSTGSSRSGSSPLGDAAPRRRDLPVLGDVLDLDARRGRVAEHRVERVIVSHRGLDEDAVLELLRRCKRAAR